MLSFYSSSNGIVNPIKAISACINESLPDPTLHSTVKLIVLHATIGHDHGAILEQAMVMCPNARIVGCSCAGVIGVEGANENMRALAVMLVCGDENEIFIDHNTHIDGKNSYDVANKMAKNLKAQSSNINMIQIYAQGIDIAADRALAGIEEEFGPEIPLFGGTASDNMKAINSFQFIDNQIIETGIIMIAYADVSLSIDMVVHHGSLPIGRGFEVTQCERNRIIQIENRPAWPYLMDRLDLPHDTHPGPCIPIAGIGVELPPELQDEYHNKYILRVIVKVDNDGSFYLPVECQNGLKLWLTQRNEKFIFEGLEIALNRLKDKIKSKEVLSVFHTDCAARGRAMFDKINKEEIIDKMQTAICQNSSIPWLGMYGYGEITRLGDRNRFHNYTTSIYAISRAATKNNS